MSETQAQAGAARLRNRRNAVTIAAGIKLAIFTVVSLLVTGLLAAIMGNVGFGSGTEYQAVFTSASMLEKGDDVRVAGVSVGEVKKVEHHERNGALVTFRVKSDVPLTTASRAEIRFLNLVGDRYLALEEGAADAGAAKRLEAEGRIPVEQTAPALDLTVLFNGFQPLFQALNPKQVNELSMNLVQVLQGEGGTVQGLLAKTASLTTTLADRDQLIGEVVDNLGQTLETVDSRHQQLSSLIVELKDWMTDLAKDRETIGSSLENVSDLTVVVADLLREGRPILKSDVAELRKLASLLNEKQNRKNLVELLDRLPESMTDQTRTGTYGSWYSYYVCGFSARITLPVISDVPGLKEIQAALNNLDFHSSAPRCNGATEENGGAAQ
ncbi:MCE family protein [Nocardioides lianchengensis]|uniref:Phospholipid/cholesterol/gamma-HCH transport system substrate-binding protein n=1 Tax=Nocardioides lianchengensis TaxID=1045774 RepID=A0A1G6RFL9_9ACTN|nr:MCE family protein [Nocardioides lianchengensis]NYG10256.1 phospholipid/cholesterol/gamma-HCH transport system substrate-binding protein [Nocardioides lianchengensis]SDD03241.1 phospholipid/cholesterol/gamma-HCH transport system substrate-binding protein [Nocardioides lianchengensis]